MTNKSGEKKEPLALFSLVALPPVPSVQDTPCATDMVCIKVSVVEDGRCKLLGKAKQLEIERIEGWNVGLHIVNFLCFKR